MAATKRPITVFVDEALAEALNSAAAKEGISRSNYIRQALENCTVVPSRRFGQ